jgi:hypothetical protein
MKTLTFSPLSLILFGLLFFLSLPSFGGKEDSLYTVELDGKLFIPENDESRFYQLELMSDNVVLETGIVVDGENFLLRVKKNSLYTIRITKEGHVPMVVSVSTNPEKDNKQNFRFDNSYFTSLHGFTFLLSLQNQETLVSR